MIALVRNKCAWIFSNSHILGDQPCGNEVSWKKCYYGSPGSEGPGMPPALLPCVVLFCGCRYITMHWKFSLSVWPQYLAMVFQDLLTTKDDYLRASRALLREIIKQTKHEINFQAFCLGLMQERKEAQYAEMEFKVPLWPLCCWTCQWCAGLFYSCFSGCSFFCSLSESVFVCLIS